MLHSDEDKSLPPHFSKLDRTIGEKLKKYQEISQKYLTPEMKAKQKELAIEIEQLLKNDKAYIRTRYFVPNEADRASKFGIIDLIQYSWSGKKGKVLQDDIRHERIEKYAEYFQRKVALQGEYREAIQEVFINVQQACQDDIDRQGMTQHTFDRMKLLDQRIADLIREFDQTKNRDIVKDELAEVLMRQRALHKQAMKQFGDEMEEYINWIDEANEKVENNPFDRTYLSKRPANGSTIFNRITNYKKYLEKCKGIFHAQGKKSTQDYIKMMGKISEFEKIGRGKKRDIMSIEDDKTAYSSYQYHKIAQAQKILVRDASIMNLQDRQEEFELINREIKQMEKVIISEKNRLIKKPARHSKGSKKIALRIDIMQGYVEKLKKNQATVSKSIQQAEVNKVKQHNALANALSSRHRYDHTADGKYVVFIPTDEEFSAPNGKDLKQELRKYENTYQQYKNSVTVEANLPYKLKKIEVIKDSVTVVDRIIGKKDDGKQLLETEELTIDEYLARREQFGFPNYLFPVTSEEGLSKVFDLGDNVAKVYRIPGNYNPNEPKEMDAAIKNISIQTEPAPSIPNVLNTNANKDTIDGGSANRDFPPPITVTIDKKCGDKDFIELIRDHAEDIENEEMDRTTSNNQINQIVLQQLKLKQQWKNSKNPVFHMDEKAADWRVTPPSSTDGHSTDWRVYQVDRDSLSSYKGMNNKINSRKIEAQNGMTLNYIPNKLNAKKRDHNVNYSTTIGKYRNYRQGIDMLNIAINQSLTNKHLKRQIKNVDDLLDQIDYIEFKPKINEKITDQDIKELETCMKSVGHLLSTSDRELIKSELKEHGYIKNKGLGKKLIHLKDMIALDRGGRLIEKIARIKNRDDFNGQLTSNEEAELFRLVEGNYLEYDYRQMILKGDFDNPKLQARLEPLRAMLRADNAKDCYVRAELTNRVALIQQGLVSEAFDGLEGDQFELDLSATLIRDFDDDNIEDLSLEDIILLHENREAVNAYLLRNSHSGAQAPEQRTELIKVVLDSLKSNEFEHEFNNSLVKNYMKANAAQLSPNDIDIIQRYNDVIVNSLASKNVINIKDIEQRNKIVSETIDNARYLIKYIEQGRPDKALSDKVESKTGLRGSMFKSKQQKNIEYLAKQNPRLADGIVTQANRQFNDKTLKGIQIDKGFRKNFNKRLKNVSQKIPKKITLKKDALRHESSRNSVQVSNALNIKKNSQKTRDTWKQPDKNKSVNSHNQDGDKIKSKQHSYQVRYFKEETTPKQHVEISSENIIDSKTIE